MSLYNKARHRASNVTTRAFAKPLFPWKGSTYYIFCACVCSLGNLACKEQALYYIVICGLIAPIYFPKLSHERHDLRGGKTLFGIKCFSTTFGRNIYHPKKNSARYYHNCT